MAHKHAISLNIFKYKSRYIIILILTNKGDYKQLLQVFVRSHEPLNSTRWLYFIRDISFILFSKY